MLISKTELKYTGVAIVRIGALDIIVTEKRGPIVLSEQFATLGVPLEDYQIIAVKLGYLMPKLRDLAGTRFMVLTPGPSQLNLKDLRYSKLDAGMEIFSC